MKEKLRHQKQGHFVIPMKSPLKSNRGLLSAPAKYAIMTSLRLQNKAFLNLAAPMRGRGCREGLRPEND